MAECAWSGRSAGQTVSLSTSGGPLVVAVEELRLRPELERLADLVGELAARVAELEGDAGAVKEPEAPEEPAVSKAPAKKTAAGKASTS